MLNWHNLNRCLIFLWQIVSTIVMIAKTAILVISVLLQCSTTVVPTLVTVSPHTLRWRHNDHTGVSNHQPHGCLLNRLFRRRSKKTSKLRVTGLCAGNSPGPVNSPHKGPVTRKMFPFDDVIMMLLIKFMSISCLFVILSCYLLSCLTYMNFVLLSFFVVSYLTFYLIFYLTFI